MRSTSFLFVISLILILVDIYVFVAVRAVLQNASDRWKMPVYILYWVISAFTIIFLFSFNKIPWERFPHARSYFMVAAVGFFFAKVSVVLFLLLDDGRRAIMWIVEKFRSAPAVAAAVAEGNKHVEGISRSQFLMKSGMLFGGTVFGTLMYGLSNKYNYHVRKIRLSYANLPAAFKGMKIVQLSDIHSGSFANKEAVARGVQLVNAQKPDLVLFTGDLVNELSSEMDDYMDVFNKVKAPMGVYSTLGNHDYGDYYNWDDYDQHRFSRKKAANLDRLKAIHSELGWRLLMNENVLLERNNEQIALIGIENWSENPRFPRKGDLHLAYEGTANVPFKILLSHDPSHWDAQVRPLFPDIDLMLAGHTHGMQFGVEIPFFKWSPAQYLYKQWAGLYEQDKQKLYVNRGYGFLGYPGRVGIMPEITVIELV